MHRNEKACADFVVRLPKEAALVLRRMVLEFGAKRSGPPNITAWHSRYERQPEKTDADLTVRVITALLHARHVIGKL